MAQDTQLCAHPSADTCSHSQKTSVTRRSKGKNKGKSKGEAKEKEKKKKKKLEKKEEKEHVKEKKTRALEGVLLFAPETVQKIFFCRRALSHSLRTCRVPLALESVQAHLPEVPSAPQKGDLHLPNWRVCKNRKHYCRSTLSACLVPSLA